DSNFKTLSEFLELFEQHMNLEAADLLSATEAQQLENTKLPYTKAFPSSAIVPYLERFMRYCLMREMVINEEYREFADGVVAHLLNWLTQYEYLSQSDKQRIFDLQARVDATYRKCWRAQQDLQKFVLRGLSNNLAGSNKI